MCTQETFRALDAFEARSDDVLLASYPKFKLDSPYCQ
uniref:Sulfotransferase family, cytosolic, 6B, member 1 n=1 Tax=Mus musculus TaxID=10090 RepID=E0CYC7_MOUSE